MSDHYILDGKKPVPCEDLLTWARWMADTDRRIARTIQDDVIVSTVFLGMDHGYGRKPILFETKVFFDGQPVGDCERYATWDEAVAGHKRLAVETFKARPILVLPVRPAVLSRVGIQKFSPYWPRMKQK